jgi:hypothetical protein
MHIRSYHKLELNLKLAIISCDYIHTHIRFACTYVLACASHITLNINLFLYIKY